VICSTEYAQRDCNRQEDRSSQWEAKKRSVGLSTARLVGAHRDRYQRRWKASVRHLICVNVRRTVWDWTAEIETVIDIATPRRRLKSSEDRSLRSCERSAACIRSLAKLSLVTFSIEEPVNRLYYCWSHWLNNRNCIAENIDKILDCFVWLS